MSTSLEDLKTRISELKSDLALVTKAFQLRPRLGEVLNWDGPAETVCLTQEFMDAKGARPEGIYGPFVVRLMAIVERYLRLLVVEGLEQHTSSAKKIDDLPRRLVNRNTILTGQILTKVESPRDYLSFDVEVLIANLASCRTGSTAFKLNAQAFSANVTGVSPVAIDRALETIEVEKCWDTIGSNAALEKLLGTKGPRPTGLQCAERLKELSRWRNHLAHGEDEIAITETQLRDAIEFVSAFCSSLDSAVKKHLKASAKSR